MCLAPVPIFMATLPLLMGKWKCERVLKNVNNEEFIEIKSSDIKKKIEKEELFYVFL